MLVVGRLELCRQVQPQRLAGFVFENHQHRQHPVFIRVQLAERRCRLGIGQVRNRRDGDFIQRLVRRRTTPPAPVRSAVCPCRRPAPSLYSKERNPSRVSYISCTSSCRSPSRPRSPCIYFTGDCATAGTSPTSASAWAFCRTPFKRRVSGAIWFHAVSVGEVLSHRGTPPPSPRRTPFRADFRLHNHAGGTRHRRTKTSRVWPTASSSRRSTTAPPSAVSCANCARRWWSCSRPRSGRIFTAKRNAAERPCWSSTDASPTAPCRATGAGAGSSAMFSVQPDEILVQTEEDARRYRNRRSAAREGAASAAT